VIQVGLGSMGRVWYQELLAQNKDVETVAWVEIVEETLAHAIREWPLPKESCFTSLEQALTSYEADAVVITTNLAGHVSSARTALQAGKHVLTEKPFAPTLAEAQELVALAAQKDCILMIDQNYRFNPYVHAARQLIEEHMLGRVGTVSIDFRQCTNIAPVERHRQYHLWQPLLADMAVHHFDLMRFVLGQEAQSISCTSWNPSWSHFVEPPAAAATITFDGGAVVTYRGNWVSLGQPTTWTGTWHMDCDEGEITWCDRRSRPQQREYLEVHPLHSVAPPPIDIPTLAQRDFMGSLAAFVDAIDTGAQPGPSGQDNIKTLALMLAAIESAEMHGSPVAIASKFGK
jgi:predicted dehydrogenase